MTKFITGKELEKVITDIIWEAKKQLLILSPFIKLDSFFIETFEPQINNPDLHLLIVFGKNEHDKSKSLNSNDFEFFKRFPKVSIIYVPNLHAKYYGNETKGVITSINMYDYSFKNNIEFGVLTEFSLLGNLTQSTDKDAWDKCIDIAQQGEPVFIKRPIFKKKFLGMGKDFTSATILLDNTDSFYSYKSKQTSNKKLPDFPEELDFNDQHKEKPTREHYTEKPQIKEETVIFNNNSSNTNNIGYCIRTGVEIPFNPKRPYSDNAYRSWSRFNNYDYQENFCHKTGKSSSGKTSMNRPILQQVYY